MHRKNKRFLIFSVLGVVITPTLAYFVGNKFYKLAMDPNTDKTLILNAPHNRIKKKKALNDIEDKYDALLKKNAFIISFDKLNLQAKKIYNTNKTNNWVILCHGFGGINIAAKKAALKFFGFGFNLLIPDLRGFGKTLGNYIGWGWHDRLDIADWCKSICKENKEAKIVLWGMSMGASTIMATCGENLPANVKAAIEDSGYSSLWDQFFYQYKLVYKTPAFPVLALASSFTKAKLGFSFRDVNLINQVKKTKIPMLFIHGDKDTFVPTQMVNRLYSSCVAKKQKLIIKNSGHVEGMFKNKKLYWLSVRKFLKEFL
ncbi:MAG: alpha/beta hydrolase [Oscillospiraceae bacterium]|jgi:fermentation-respiration switch protein FrsA (DUF1100 family)|nr:alpha/beta hydrolase [Oscillospiraceae bacterium]